MDAPLGLSLNLSSSFSAFSCSSAFSPTKGPTSSVTSPVMDDRYIPHRDANQHELSQFVLSGGSPTTPVALSPVAAGKCPSKSSRGPSLHVETYSSAIARTLFPDSSPSVVGMTPPLLSAAYLESETDRYNRTVGVVYHENRARNFRSKSFRIIPQTPERILDAPELLDDFYLNLLDWSSRNLLTVALANTVYLWNAENGGITQLMSNQERENIITAVGWHSGGATLAVGTNDNEIQLWDTETQKLVRRMESHHARVGSLSWNGFLLASGSRDTTVCVQDTRDTARASTIHCHTQEVCGLKWSPNGSYLACGGNDNLLSVWDIRRHTLEHQPLWKFSSHCAAIKALAWNPSQHNLLASGGGTADKTLRFWDISTGECLMTVDTKSQVCGVLWNLQGTELVSSHGYSNHQLSVWKYPSMKRVTDLTGHTSRVLHLAISPDGEVIVSAAGDETIRFWRCFGSSNCRNRKVGSGAVEGTTPSNMWSSPQEDSLR